MFHACFMTIPTCFVHTLYRFDAFSGTNLLTRCRSASSCFLLFLVPEILQRKYSRNWMKSTPKILFFHEASREPEGGQGAPPHKAARPRGGALWCGCTRPPPRMPFRLYKVSASKTLKT